MCRAIREIQPRWVVGENVSGLISWNGGMVFDEVQADLGAAGYEVIPFVLPACGTGAPHRRDRIFFVAHCNDTGTNKRVRTDGNGTEENNGRQGFAQSEFGKDGGDGSTQNPNSNGRGSDEWQSQSGIRGFGNTGTGDNERIPTNDDEIGDATHTGSIGQQGQGTFWKSINSTESRNRQADWYNYDNERWERFPTQPPVCSRNDGLPGGLVGTTFFESIGIKHPRKPAISASKHRQESIKGYGNAIVPQVALQIFKAIEAWDKMYK